MGRKSDLRLFYHLPPLSSISKFETETRKMIHENSRKEIFGRPRLFLPPEGEKSDCRLVPENAYATKEHEILLLTYAKEMHKIPDK
jgi:hypothetical protein